MKITTLLSHAIILSIVLISCQKEPIITPDAPPSPEEPASMLLKSVSSDVYSPVKGYSRGLTYFSYDDKDRLISVTDSARPEHKTIYAYPSSSKITLDRSSVGFPKMHIDFFLNSQSLIDTSFQYTDNGDTMSVKYIYNDANQLITKLEYGYAAGNGPVLWTTSTHTYDAEGNLIKYQANDEYEVLNEYYSDHKYIIPGLMPYETIPRKSNLLKKTTLNYKGNPLGWEAFSYTFDKHERMSTKRIEGPSNEVVIVTYNYIN